MSLSRPFFLFEIAYPSGSDRRTDADATVVWSGNAFAASPIAIAGLGRSSVNFVETLEVRAQNVDRYIAAQVLSQNVQGSPVRVWTSRWTAPGSFQSPVLVFEGQFDGVSIQEGERDAEASFEAKNDFVRWEANVPRNSFASTCQWKFKSETPGCQYTGAGSLCNKTPEACNAYGNIHRFRGFRFVSKLGDKEIWWGLMQPGLTWRERIEWTLGHQ